MSPCIEWTGRFDRHGYGRCYHNGQMQGAHRVAFAQVYGPIPSGIVVMHLCDNPPCINPEHLRLGTQADNLADALTKGRRKVPNPKGTEHGSVKLTEAAVRAIRASTESGIEAARRYGVSRSTVCGIRKGRTWKHVV